MRESRCLVIAGVSNRRGWLPMTGRPEAAAEPHKLAAIAKAVKQVRHVDEIIQLELTCLRSEQNARRILTAGPATSAL